MNFNQSHFKISSCSNGEWTPIGYFQTGGYIKLLMDVFNGLPGYAADSKAVKGKGMEQAFAVEFIPALDYNKIYYGTEAPEEYAKYIKFVNGEDLPAIMNKLANVYTDQLLQTA
jgi:hypothetical protein